MNNSYNAIAEIFKALSDENRLRIIELLQKEEKCANTLLEELNIAQPTLSHHMKILCLSGMVDSRRDGKKTFYSLNKDNLDNARQLLDDIMDKPVSSVPVWIL